MVPLSPGVHMAGQSGVSKWWVILTVAMGMVATILPSGTFNVAVPALMRDFGLGQDSVQLVITTFMAANTVAMLATPWLIQRFGVQRCFSAAMALLIITSVLGSLSSSFGALLAARLLQGTTAAIMTPMGSIVVMRMFPPERQGRAFGVHALSIALALAIAPTIGGVLVDFWSWRAVCLLPVPIGLVAWMGALRLIPHECKNDHSPFDSVGMMLLSMLTLTWLASFSRPANVPREMAELWLLGCLVLAILTLALFIRHVRQAGSPLVNGELLRRRILMVGGLVNFLLGSGMYGAMYLMPVFLQEVLGLSASRAGAAQFPATLTLALTFPMAGILADHLKPRHLISCGLALFAASFVLLWHYGDTISYLGFIWITVMGRIGQSFALTPISKVALAGLHGSSLSQASMVLSYLCQLGGVLGVAGVAAFISWRTIDLSGGAAAIAQAFAEGYLLVALFLGLAIIASTQIKAQGQD